MSDDPISERDGMTLAEMAQELEEWRASRKRVTEPCPHCGHTPARPVTESELITLIGYLLGGQKGAAHLRGITVGTVKGKMTHLYRKLGVENAMQTAYLLGRGDLNQGGGVR